MAKKPHNVPLDPSTFAIVGEFNDEHLAVLAELLVTLSLQEQENESPKSKKTKKPRR
jgi:hypothetical protein